MSNLRISLKVYSYIKVLFNIDNETSQGQVLDLKIEVKS